MRKIFIALASFFTIIGIVFTFLPLETLALLPIGIGIIMALIALKKSNDNQKKLPKIILVIIAMTILVVVGKQVFIKDEVKLDNKFNQQKIDSKQEAQKELEELEGL